ncbi:glucarate dehydratase [Arthrobacter sp. MYb224]|uniref:enolase C-terminal domain-like protein n=1 Tax=Micrococcaceae TaxID=1268 RepID=UPI000CFCD870|nr:MULTISPECIES: enolase C-terminal domain-like protein [unclassified Arthrobacter]PRA00464.1 glucarate dehydratase [Arthrobacter sp. MYb224]PRA04656.1 glucarate dehydratase [Arthrobacter sp. MYb229]PRB51431.1 glucarate dehydratase [Arthrobacter sp. MYb216]
MSHIPSLGSLASLTPHTSRPPVRISDIQVTPVAFADPPLLNSVGVHEPFALRAIVVVRTEGGHYGLGETYGDAVHVSRLRRAAASLIGADAFNTNRISSLVSQSLLDDNGVGGHGTGGMVTTTSLDDRVLSAFDVACLDIQGKILGVPVSTLLGGAVRDEVEFSGYLFYKWAAHPGLDDDSWGEALDPAGIVAQARRMVRDCGFKALKLKGGVFPPDQEAEAILALRQRFPDIALRIDPNGVWTVETAIRIGQRLAPVLEYLEDPCLSIADNAQVRAAIDLPVATNMCVVSFNDLPPAIEAGAVDVVLSDHHFWGGLNRSRLLAGIAETFDLRLSMHSNSHLGISFAAMIQLAAATKNIDYACDTHWPWKRTEDDVIVPGVLEISDGAVKVPTSPGLGVELDEVALERMHQQYLDCGMTKRDDTSYMQGIDPTYELKSPRW